MASPDFYASSPTVVLPPPPPTQHVGGHYSPFMNGSSSTFGPSLECNRSSPPALASSLAGRKRSRGDITAPDDDEDDASSPAPVDQQLGGPAACLAYDSKVDASMVSNTDPRVATSMVEGTERSAPPTSHLKRPSVSSRKSQRTNAGAPGADHLAQLVLPSSMREATTEPLIDEATRVLGISWARMDSTEALRINQAAYQKWIQKYYPSLKDVNIWFENSAIPGYLVCAVNSYNDQQAWYIFSHDLTEARIVTTESTQLVPRLQMLPALHLAAPGGQIHAETDPVGANQSLTGVDQAQTIGNLEPPHPAHDHEPMSMDSARQMDID
nr:hypothetical protein CFP56_28829 [Quercus suber]